MPKKAKVNPAALAGTKAAARFARAKSGGLRRIRGGKSPRQTIEVLRGSREIKRNLLNAGVVTRG